MRGSRIISIKRVGGFRGPWAVNSRHDIANILKKLDGPDAEFVTLLPALPRSPRENEKPEARHIRAQDTVVRWLSERGHADVAPDTCSALREAGIPEAEWLLELKGMESDGVLNDFIATVRASIRLSIRQAVLT